jgi:hypothetical protein
VSTPPSSPPHHHPGSTPRLVVLILGPIATFYALCWLVAIVYIQIKVQVTLPPEAREADARATLYFEHGATQSIERSGPLETRLAFDFRGGIGSLRHFIERVEKPTVTVEIGKCKPIELPIECGPWTIRAPNYLVLGAWSASFARECSARGNVSCPRR